MFSFLAKWLRRSSHVHIRQGDVHTLRQLIELVDRFLDDQTFYELEWDDFVSWENANPAVEAVRRELEQLEPLFLGKGANISEGTRQMLALRNRVAESIGLDSRALHERE